MSPVLVIVAGEIVHRFKAPIPAEPGDYLEFRTGSNEADWRRVRVHSRHWWEDPITGRVQCSLSCDAVPFERAATEGEPS